MFKINQKKAQAVTELAVFGAILIYLLGTIVRSAVGNSLTQNDNFKAMRQAMLSSWQGSLAANISRNSASILIVEDRLSPDFNKYGALDRNPYITIGSGTFSYELLYPLTPGQDNMQAQMPVMDIYINGQYFPLNTAAYVSNKVLLSPEDGYQACSGTPESPVLAQQQCLQDPSKTQQQCALAAQTQCNLNQCLRYRREWVGGTITADQFNDVILPVTATDANCKALTGTIAQDNCQAGINGGNIFAMLIQAPNALIDASPNGTSGKIDINEYPSQWSAFETRYANEYTTYFPSPPYPNFSASQIQTQLNSIQQVLNSKPALAYKLFYTIVANPVVPGAIQTAPAFSVNPPTCSSHPCTNQELSTDLTLGAPPGVSNANGDLMFDYQRLNIPANQPNTTIVPAGMRPYMAWQWAATAGTTASLIGLNTSNNQFPNYDIDGRLKEVTIFGISYNPSTGEPTVSYMDPQGGDIDSSWDSNSCTPKPGLQNDSEIFTFTQSGTYLQIREGKLSNPETGQVVRSQTKRDTIDLIQRTIQLSNNTGRFCNGATPLSCIANDCADYPPATRPNPVEVCVAPNSVDAQGKNINCFSSEYNIKSTCFDEDNNMLYVRSRLADLRGHFWMTNTSGQLKVQQ